jgi:phosphoadenosine phosphosulfate reductase
MKEDIQLRLKEIEVYLKGYMDEGKQFFASSSFQSHSIPMLHILNSIAPNFPVYFIDTGFHFPETLEFRDYVASQLNLNVKNQRGATSLVNQLSKEDRFLFQSDPGYCCTINKTQPMDSLMMQYDIWITGVRKDQNANRNSMGYEAEGPHNTMRFHPMIHWNSKMIWEYRKMHNLPTHPLEEQGFLSIGCLPCTQKFSLETDDGRGGRWKGMKKNECGLHTDLIK